MAQSFTLENRPFLRSSDTTTLRTTPLLSRLHLVVNVELVDTPVVICSHTDCCMVITSEDPFSHIHSFHQDYKQSFVGKGEPLPTKDKVLDEIGKILQNTDGDQTGSILLGDYTEATANFIRVGRQELTQGFEGFWIREGFRCTHCPRFGDTTRNNIFVSKKQVKGHIKKCHPTDLTADGFAFCNYQELIKNVKMTKHNSLYRIEVNQLCVIIVVYFLFTPSIYPSISLIHL